MKQTRQPINSVNADYSLSEKLNYLFLGFKFFHPFSLHSDIIDNFEEYQEQFHLLIRFVKKNAPSHWIDVSNQSQYRIESGRLSTHLGPSWKRKCVQRRRIRPSFLSPPKESGSRIFSTPLPLSLSLPPPSTEPPLHAILPYLTTQPSQRSPSYVCVPSNRSPASLVNHSLNSKNYSNKFTIRGGGEEQKKKSKRKEKTFPRSSLLVQGDVFKETWNFSRIEAEK